MNNIFNIFKNKKGNKPNSNGKWKEIEHLLQPYKRKAWIPEVKDQVSNPHSSKFSGIPALSKGEEWPCCANCNEPMQLFLQLNAKDLPEQDRNVFEDGLLQVFYCTNFEKQCEVDCEAFFPFSKSTLVRIVHYKSSELAALERSPVRDAYPEKEIISWIKKDDYPNWEEVESLGVTLTDEQSDILGESGYPRPGDKLFGWPCWVQGVEYPDCPECGKAMQLVFQIDSEDNVPYMFGDSGCAHITQCPQHQNILAIAWACC